MKSNSTLAIEELLKQHGFRLTLGRIALITFLKDVKKPISAREMQLGMKYKMDKVTLYRALEDFSKAKIIAKINLQDTATYYEFMHKHHHHHHIVCEGCGTIEDIRNCNQSDLEKEVLASSKRFTTINSHSLEFFGTCKACSR